MHYRVAQGIYDELKPFQAKRRELEQNQDYITKVIREGAERAHATEKMGRPMVYFDAIDPNKPEEMFAIVKD